MPATTVTKPVRVAIVESRMSLAAKLSSPYFTTYASSVGSVPDNAMAAHRPGTPTPGGHSEVMSAYQAAGPYPTRRLEPVRIIRPSSPLFAIDRLGTLSPHPIRHPVRYTKLRSEE